MEARAWNGTDFRRLKLHSDVVSQPAYQLIEKSRPRQAHLQLSDATYSVGKQRQRQVLGEVKLLALQAVMTLLKYANGGFVTSACIGLLVREAVKFMVASREALPLLLSILIAP